MKCPKCGNSGPDVGATFCAYCGAPLVPGALAPPRSSVRPAHGEPPVIPTPPPPSPQGQPPTQIAKPPPGPKPVPIVSPSTPTVSSGQVSSGQVQTGVIPKGTVKLPSAERRRGLVWAAAALVVVALGAAGVWAYSRTAEISVTYVSVEPASAPAGAGVWLTVTLHNSGAVKSESGQLGIGFRQAGQDQDVGASAFPALAPGGGWTDKARVAVPAAASLGEGSFVVTVVVGGEIRATREVVFTVVEQTPKVGLAFDIGGLGDKTFNDSAYAGLERAIADFKLGDQETAYLEPTEGGADHEQLLRTLAKQGYGFVIANGLLFSEALSKVMAEFPNTKFAITDGYIADLTEASNVLCWGFAEHEGSFLVGVAAAMASKTGKIGFVGGVQFPLIEKFEAGYVAGARWVNPNIKVVVNYIGSTIEAFRDPIKGKELALAQYQAGCDVVYHASGPSGAGVIAAAAEQQKWVIGVDSDQYLTAPEEEKRWVLTSMMKNLDVAVYDTIDKFLKGTFVGGYTTYNLAVDGVGYSTSNTALTAEMIARMEEAKAKIVSGEIVVPIAPGQ